MFLVFVGRRNDSEAGEETTHETRNRQPSYTGTLSDQFLLGVANKIGKEYFNVGISLGFDKSVVEQIQHAYPGDIKRMMFEILSRWKKNSPKRRDHVAMVKQLCKALSENGHGDVADYVIDQMDADGVRAVVPIDMTELCLRSCWLIFDRLSHAVRNLWKVTFVSCFRRPTSSASPRSYPKFLIGQHTA
ncbi:hypothetical protein LSAT2_006272 [Lamellibrachia satsuma]|nr:hypothetical protein LSAT2_006272 [Lamellibrachia satsuma]